MKDLVNLQVNLYVGGNTQGGSQGTEVGSQLRKSTGTGSTTATYVSLLCVFSGTMLVAFWNVM